MTVVSPFGGIVSSVLFKRIPRSKELLLLISNAMILTSMTLFARLPIDQKIPPITYGAQVILGLAFGLQTAVFLFVIREHVQFKDMATAVGVRNTCGALGGCISVAMFLAIAHDDLKHDLPDLLSPEDAMKLAKSFHVVDNFSTALAKEIREVYGRSFGHQFRALAVVAGCNVAVAVIMVLVANLKLGHAIVSRKRVFSRVDVELGVFLEYLRRIKYFKVSGCGMSGW